MEAKPTEGNLRIAVRKTQNGEVVYHKRPINLEFEDDNPQTEQYSFEWNRNPDFKKEDWHRCLHYHIGYIIDDIARWMLNDEANWGYDIEVIIKPMEKSKK